MGHCHLRARQQVRAGTGKAALSPGVPPLQLRSPGGDRHPSSAPREAATSGVFSLFCPARNIFLSTPSSFPNPGLPSRPPPGILGKTETLKVLVTTAFVSPAP